jgi:threonine/homoserine/homoserine lactone efflux protein
LIQIRDFRWRAFDVSNRKRRRIGLGLVEFLFAVGGLLLTPGPTNTLLALAGASVGLRRTFPLISAEISGYLAVVLPLALFGQALVDRWPVAGDALTLAAAIWVMYLAVRLWQPAAQAVGTLEVTWGRVFVTTLLNPKGLIFGLVLLPAMASPDFLTRLGAFCLLIVVVASLWAGFGARMGRNRTDDRPPVLFRRAAACWLGLLSIGLVAGMVQA